MAAPNTTRNSFRTPIQRHFFDYSLLQLLGDVTGKSVLDMGCYGGNNSRLVKRQGATRVVGIYSSIGLVEVARRYERECPLGVQYIMYNQIARLRNSQFDVVTMTMSINYLTGQDHLLNLCQAAYKHLAPGGRLVAILSHRQPSRNYFNFRNLGFTINCVDASHRVTQGIVKVFVSDVPGQQPMTDVFYLFDKATIEYFLGMAGFSRIRWQPCSLSPVSGFPEEHWKDIVDSQFFMGVTCEKVIENNGARS